MATGDDKRLRQLENDFNHGDPIDMLKYKTLLEGIALMGFTAADGLEAALVCDTVDNLEAVTDYLLESEKKKKSKYDKRKKEMAQEVKIAPEKQKLIDEMNRYLRELEQEKQKQMQLEQELQERQAVTKMQKYIEFVRGITADEVVTEKEMEELMKYREANLIGEEEHRDALGKLELTPEELIDMKQGQKESGGKICVKCNEGSKDHVVFPCMHVCVCENCVQSVLDNQNSGGPGAGCPVCGKEVTKIERIYAD